MNIVEAIQDRRLLGSLFKDPSTWGAWLVYLRALFGLPIDAADGRKLYRDCTGLERQTRAPTRESYVICGRRSGKSFISAVIAVYLACFRDWTAHLSAGERGWIFIIAVDKAQAQIIKRYISGILHGNRLLRAKVERETREGLELAGRVSIAVKTCSFRTIRGYTLLAAILEEIAFWRSDVSANPDREVLAAVRPALATIPASLLIGISTPYSRTGVLYEQWRTHWGQAGGALVWRAATEVMNPTIDRGLIGRALAEDPEAAKAEWQAEWRQDITAFLPEELVQACAVPGRHELPRVEEVAYVAFIDPSGGRQDSFCIAIAHREGTGRVVLDVLRERTPPFRPEAVVEEYAALLHRYGVAECGSDRYAGEWVTDSFQRRGITVRPSPLPSSELYLELLPAIMQGAIELLDSKRLVTQLAGLERRTRAGGRDLVAHYPGGHDDLAVACAGAYVAARAEVGTFAFLLSRHFVYGSAEEDVPRDITARDDVERYLKDRNQ